jgi:SDR family mycofactocin-dependent oxidoreductase
MGRLDGKVALITGVARGQGRSHALRLAADGAQIVGLDLCASIDTVTYPLSTPDDLAETVRAVEELDQRIVARRADVRDRAALAQVVKEGVAEFGRLDIVLANAGILPAFDDIAADPRSFDDVIEVNLTGVYNTIEAALPQLLEQGQGGSIVITSSVAGLHGKLTLLGNAGLIGYTAAKHGVVGLMRTYAGLLAEHSIRVNSVHPTAASTPMVVHAQWAAFAEENPAVMANLVNAMPVELIEAIDISNAIAWLCSDEARYITGIALPVDAGFLLR